MSDKRPKSLRVPTEPPSALTPSGAVAASIGMGIHRLLKDTQAGYILIILDERGASLATSEEPEEAANVMAHFMQNPHVFANGFVVRDCPCSHCEAYRRGEEH